MKRGSAKKTISAEEFDRKFDNGEDVSEYIDWDKAEWPGLEVKRVNVDFPNWMVTELDREAGRLGIPRQSLIKYWIGQRLDETREARRRHEPVLIMRAENSDNDE